MLAAGDFMLQWITFHLLHTGPYWDPSSTQGVLELAPTTPAILPTTTQHFNRTDVSQMAFY